MMAPGKRSVGVFYREETEEASHVRHGTRLFKNFGRSIPPFAREMLSRERNRWTLWSPVFFGIGILIYFQLTFEPPAWLLLATPICLIAALILYRYSSTIALIYTLPLILIVAGFNIASIRTATVAAPVLHKNVGAQYLEGRVIAVDGREGKRRLLIGDLSFDNEKRIPKLEYVRMTYRTKGIDPSPGQYVRLMAVLLPPPGPVIPGGFDYQRQIYYQKIGAVGYIVKHPEIMIRQGSLKDEARIMVNRLRLDIRDRVMQGISKVSAGFAVTIMTGDKSGIDKDVLTAMRASGLAHLLAISGLHMGLIGGLIFFAARLLLSLSPAIALQLPVKKIAAVMAIFGMAFYLALSGFSISALRAFIMAGLAFVAICVDRNAFSMRMVVLAAMIVLILLPESLLGPSFQMSFAAVFALIAVYESWGRKFVRSSRQSGIVKKFRLYLAGVVLTTIVASSATAPFAIYHFGQFPLYGLIGNLVAVPIMGLWIMPMVLLTLLAIPFGLEHMPLLIMGQGIEIVQHVSGAVADLPHSILWISNLPASGIFVASLSGLWFLLWKEKWRYLSVLGLVPVFLIHYLQPLPDIVISDSGNLLGYKDQAGRLNLTSGRKDRFARGKWKRHFGSAETQIIPRDIYRENANVNCDPSGCKIVLGTKILTYSQSPHAVLEDCRRAEIIISPYPVNFACKKAKTVIDKFSFWQNGAYAITGSDNNELEIYSANGIRGTRPWVPKKKFKKKSPKETK